MCVKFGELVLSHNTTHIETFRLWWEMSMMSMMRCSCQGRNKNISQKRDKLERIKQVVYKLGYAKNVVLATATPTQKIMLHGEFTELKNAEKEQDRRKSGKEGTKNETWDTKNLYNHFTKHQRNKTKIVERVE